MTSYPLIIEDVRRYLATKEDNDIVGYPRNSMSCLLAQTLMWLYPDMGRWRVDMLQYGASRGIGVENLTDDLVALSRAFDFGNYSWKHEITKGDLRMNHEFDEVLMEPCLGSRSH